MRVLLDESLPRRLKVELPEYEVTTVPEVGRAGTKNGELLRLAESSIDVFVTLDRLLASQRNLSGIDLCVIGLFEKTNAVLNPFPLADQLRSAISKPRAMQLVRLKE